MRRPERLTAGMSSLVYMTAESREEALNLARILAGRKLCAGINIVPGALSVYWWEGKIREKEECLLFAQVSDKALPAFMEAARALHSYQTPCVVALPLAGGSGPFLEWIENNSHGDAPCA